MFQAARFAQLQWLLTSLPRCFAVVLGISYLPVTAQVRLIKDLSPGAASTSIVGGLRPFNNQLWMTLSLGASPDREVWVYDLGGDSLYLIADLEPGVTSSMPGPFVPCGGKLFFPATVGGVGGLYVYDPATDLITRVAIDPLMMSSGRPALLQAVGNTLFFSVSGQVNSINASWPYQLDATTLVSRRIVASAGQPPIFNVSRYAELNGKYYCTAQSLPTGGELGCYDPIADTIGMKSEIFVGSASATLLNSLVQVMGSKVIWSADASTNGFLLYEYDPATNQHRRLTGSVLPQGGKVAPLFGGVFDGCLVFSATEVPWGPTLLRYCPSTDNIERVWDPVNLPVPAQLIQTIRAGRSLLYFGGSTVDNGQFPPASRFELGVYGTSGGGGVIPPSNLATNTQVPIISIATLGDTAVFNFYSSDIGSELFLWRPNSSPNSNSYTLIADIFPGPGSSFPQMLTSYNGRVFFTATSPTTGVELYEYRPQVSTAVGEDYANARSKSTLQLWPNPSQGDVALAWPGAGEQAIELAVVASDGRHLLNTAHQGLAEVEAQLATLARQLPDGLYLVQLTRGDAQQVVRWVLQR